MRVRLVRVNFIALLSVMKYATITVNLQEAVYVNTLNKLKVEILSCPILHRKK